MQSFSRALYRALVKPYVKLRVKPYIKPCIDIQIYRYIDVQTIIEPSQYISTAYQKSFRALSSRGRPPQTPHTYYILYSLCGQSSYRDFGRAFSRPFIELRIEVHVELLQSFSRASCRALVKLRAEPYTEPHAGVYLGN